MYLVFKPAIPSFSERQSIDIAINNAFAEMHATQPFLFSLNRQNLRFLNVNEILKNGIKIVTSRLDTTRESNDSYI